MKKLLLISTLTILALITPQQSIAANKAKAGAKCAKANSTQVVGARKFTCINSGSRLIWNKGVLLPRPMVATPSPAPSASPENVIQAVPNPFDLAPFPDEFTRLQLVEALFKRFEDYKKLNSSNKIFKLVIEPEFQDDSVAITKLVSDSYAVLPFPSDYPTTLVVISRDIKLVEKSVKELSGFDRTGSKEGDWRICLGCAGLGWASSNSRLGPVPPHEIFHVWQRAAYKRVNDNNPDPSNPLNPPIWLDEGGAEFFGYLLSSNNSKTYKPFPVPWKPYKLKDYTTRNLHSYLPYSLGRVASEYIVASKGFDKFFAIYWNVGSGQDFPTAFYNALGISLENFYEKFDGNLKKLL